MINFVDKGSTRVLKPLQLSTLAGLDLFHYLS